MPAIHKPEKAVMKNNIVAGFAKINKRAKRYAFTVPFLSGLLLEIG
jgi:hypothetical protein